MNHRWLASSIVVVALLTVGTAPAAGQSRSAANLTGATSALRAPDGKPSLQGNWDFRTITPLERPASQANQPVLSEAEAAAIQKEAESRKARLAAPSEVRSQPRAPGGGGVAVGAYNDFWLDFGTNVVGDRRTSLIVDPPDGRLPALTAGAKRQVASLVEDLALQRPIRVLDAGTRADGPEDRGLAERCIVGFNAGPPMMPSAYNNHLLLVQNSDYVVILNEMVHDARVIPLDGRPHLPSSIRQWMGDSRGHWEGDTLVVKTTNFSDKTASFNPNGMMALGTGSTLNLTERFRRADQNTLIYEFTVEDPTTFTRPFTAALPMRRSDELVYEYACHEGNYGLFSILRGTRAEDQAAK
jgi:hypothetical protein